MIAQRSEVHPVFDRKARSREGIPLLEDLFAFGNNEFGKSHCISMGAQEHGLAPANRMRFSAETFWTLRPHGAVSAPRGCTHVVPQFCARLASIRCCRANLHILLVDHCDYS